MSVRELVGKSLEEHLLGEEFLHQLKIVRQALLGK